MVQRLFGRHDISGIQLGPSIPGAALEHTAATHHVAERDHQLNAVIAVVARSPRGDVLARWKARGHWDDPLPVHYHGSRAPWGWAWNDQAARDTRIHTRADGTGGESVERWATAHGAATVEVMAVDIGARSSDDGEADAQSRTSSAPDHTGGAGAPGGDPHGRTGPDTTIGGAGPGGPHARAGGDHEGSKTRGPVDGSRLGSALGIDGGSAGGRFAGESKPDDDGVRMAGAIAGGVIAVPAALKGAVEILLLAEQGDVTGMGAELFTSLAKKAVGVSSAALRELVAREAREICEREVKAAAERLASSPRWLALSDGEQVRAQDIAFNEQMRRFFRGFRRVAKDAEGAATQELRDAARVGAEAAQVEPVAGRLPTNHALAGKEYPREFLDPKYREKGLRFKSTGYPDFEPYAMMLPNGKKTVRIELTGSMHADEALANKAARLEGTPKGYIWHHVEDEGTMMLVPRDLHQAVGHTGGRAVFKDRTGVDYAG